MGLEACGPPAYQGDIETQICCTSSPKLSQAMAKSGGE